MQQGGGLDLDSEVKSQNPGAVGPPKQEKCFRKSPFTSWSHTGMRGNVDGSGEVGGKAY